jgi:hypothetical protein
VAATSVTAVNPDEYSCSQAGYITFEDFADKTDLSAESFPGIEFTTTNGFTWRVGDFATGNYNGKYPSGAYTSQGTHWAWLGESQGAGRIDLTIGSAKYFSLLVSASTSVVLEAYRDDGTLLETAGPAATTTGTTTMTELRVMRPTTDIGYVVVHDSGNFFEIDAICSDASGVGLKDRDADGLPDDWESNGADIDGNGTVDLDLPAMGADADHKDLFVEVDWLTGEGSHVGPFTFGGFDARPSSASANRAITSFNNWPVPNPDGEQGIRLHLDAGSNTIMNPKTGAQWGSRSRANAIYNGKRVPDWSGWGQLDTFRNENVAKVRRGVFHYVLFVDEIGCDKGLCTTGQSRGIPGHDLVLAKGDKGVRTDQQEAVTLAHELGHNLGLGHGGRARTDDPASRDVNKKANYLSIMNYYYSNTGLVTTSGADGIIGYSPQELSTLSTTNLPETSGLSPDPFGHFRVYYKCSSSGKEFAKSDRKSGDTWGAIDWDCDGHTADGSSNTYLQDPDDVACVRVDASNHCLPANSTTVLGSEDYHHLRFWGNGQGWDARNEAMGDFGQPGTSEPTVAEAKTDGVWWPNHALVTPANPDVVVVAGSGQTSIPLNAQNAGDSSFSVQPVLAEAPTAIGLPDGAPFTLAPGATHVVQLSVDTTNLVAGEVLTPIVEFVDTDDSTTLGSSQLTIRVVGVSDSSTQTCEDARRARGTAGLAPEQVPALDAFLATCTGVTAPPIGLAGSDPGGSVATRDPNAEPPEPAPAVCRDSTQRSINLVLVGQARHRGVNLPRAKPIVAFTKRTATYGVRLTRRCVTVATGTVTGRRLTLRVPAAVILRVRRGAEVVNVKLYPRLSGRYVLESVAARPRFDPVKVVIK